MHAVIEAESSEDPDHPLALSVRMEEISEGYPRTGMEFHIEYRLRIEDDGPAKRVKGVCNIIDMSSAHQIDDEHVGEYIFDGLARSVPEVRRYLEGMFPGAEIRGTIRCLYEGAGHRQGDFVL